MTATSQRQQFSMVIGGKLVQATSRRTFESENPYTGKPLVTVPDAGVEDVDAAVTAVNDSASSTAR